MATLNWKTESSIMPNADCFTLKASDTVELHLQIYSLQIAVVSLRSNMDFKSVRIELANHQTDKRLSRDFTQPHENAIEQFKSAAVAIFKEHCNQFNKLFNQQ